MSNVEIEGEIPQKSIKHSKCTHGPIRRNNAMQQLKKCEHIIQKLSP